MPRDVSDFPVSRPVIGLMANSPKRGGLDDRWTAVLKAHGFDVKIIYPGTRLSELKEILSTVHGVVLTGGDANIHPDYSAKKGAPKVLNQQFDRRRDTTALSLARLCLQINIPILGICRGMQEMNVALGGTLHPSLKRAGFHGQLMRVGPGMPPLEKYKILFRDAHDVGLIRTGWLHGVYGLLKVATSSVHSQGIDRLAPGLRAEAYSDRVLIEAFSKPGHPFFIGVQWHAEIAYDSAHKPLWDQFAIAVQNYQAEKQRHLSLQLAKKETVKASYYPVPTRSESAGQAEDKQVPALA